jgi:hypothetical protein
MLVTPHNLSIQIQIMLHSLYLSSDYHDTPGLKIVYLHLYTFY